MTTLRTRQLERGTASYLRQTCSSRNKSREAEVNMIDRKAFKPNQLYLSNWAQTGKLRERNAKLGEQKPRSGLTRQARRAADKENAVGGPQKVLQTLGANVVRRRVVKATRKAANKVTKLVSSENG